MGLGYIGDTEETGNDPKANAHFEPQERCTMFKKDLMMMAKLAKHIEIHVMNVGFLPTTYKALDEMLDHLSDYADLSGHAYLSPRSYPKKREVLVVTIDAINA